MKVMLCLLSDQPIPNLLSVHHFQPDRLVLVESAVVAFGEGDRQTYSRTEPPCRKSGGMDHRERKRISVKATPPDGAGSRGEGSYADQFQA